MITKKQVKAILDLFKEPNIKHRDNFRYVRFNKVNDEQCLELTNSYIAVRLNFEFDESLMDKYVSINHLEKWYKLASAKDILTKSDFSEINENHLRSDEQFPSLDSIFNQEPRESAGAALSAKRLEMMSRILDSDFCDLEMTSLNGSENFIAYKMTTKTGTGVLAGMRGN